MSIHPIAVSLGLPMAAGAIGGGLKLAQQGFHKILTAVEGASASEGATLSTQDSLLATSQRLENLAQEVRDWLHHHGIRLPYSISVIDQPSDQPHLEIEGVEREKISEVLNSFPNLLTQLRNLVRSEGRVTPLGFQGKTAVVTNASSYLE